MSERDPSMRIEAEQRDRSSTGTPDAPVVVNTDASLVAAAALERKVLEDRVRAERLRMGLTEEPTPTEIKETKPSSTDSKDGRILSAVKTTAGLGVAGTAVLGQKIVKTTGYLFSDFFTAIERWGDKKLEKHPIAKRVLGAGLVVASLPFVGWSYFSGFWASAAGIAGGVAQFRDTRPSWREQDVEAGKAKPPQSKEAKGPKKK